MFLALHKIVLLITALCAVPTPQGYEVKTECTKQVIKTSNLVCDLNKEEFHQCLHNIKPMFKKGK
jgi:hypothetical protein